MTILFLIILCCVAAVQGRLNLTITADMEYHLYIDDVTITGLPNKKSYRYVDVVPLNPGADVIAVEATNTIGLHGPSSSAWFGLIASVGDTFVTDRLWRCTGRWYQAWMLRGFSDIQWQYADESTLDIIPSGIVASAKWIWNKGENRTKTYCRARLSTRRLTINAADDMELYVDGVKIDPSSIPNYNRRDLASSIRLQPLSNLIAVKATNRVGGLTGIIASVGETFVSDSSWKCVNTLATGWTSPTYDDYMWPRSVLVRDSPMVGISRRARWIWTSTQADKTVYCRVKLVCNQQFQVMEDTALLAKSRSDFTINTTAVTETDCRVACIYTPNCIAYQVRKSNGLCSVHRGYVMVPNFRYTAYEMADCTSDCLPSWTTQNNSMIFGFRGLTHSDLWTIDLSFDGNWSPWSYGTCQNDCTKTITRLCNNPEPMGRGKKCYGEATSSAHCSYGEDPVAFQHIRKCRDDQSHARQMGTFHPIDRIDLPHDIHLPH